MVGLPRTGKVWLTVGAKGHARRVVEAEPGSGDLVVVLPLGLSAAGRLLDRNGDPLAGWLVEVLAPDSDDRVAQVVTDKEGRFRVEGISAEEHRVRVHWRGVGKWRSADVGRLRGGDMAIELRTRFTD